MNKRQWKAIRPQGCGSRAFGLTLVELLVALLIIGILMAVALPLYLATIADANRKTCRANEQTIGNAVHANRVATRSTSYPIGNALALGLAPDLLTLPVCPESGSYSIEAGTGPAPFSVQCSVVAHGAFQYGVDSQ